MEQTAFLRPAILPVHLCIVNVNLSFIPLFLEDAGLLAAFTHHSHIVDYAPVDAFSCRLPASSMILGIYPYSLKMRGCWPPSLTTVT